ncbi:PHP domain-containing protein [Legionella waltersii]|uniref:Metal dependent phosphoesterase n=1 Tax=Legionella waltersii TaxID=66969 RepID=A0A0W1ALU2_9GAMM|nr:PHP domain-containing protein [Legionella waltersii]KTD82254.1 metal dependent phosphoesterase [Legionella waltersii]SNV04461.1 metal dependent phosphoesterase [Legionella waltersii]
MIDLHCHSSFSDGALNPQELLQRANENNLKCLSLTDHDTVAGCDLLINTAINSPIKIVRGIELSTRWKKNDVHILGYHIKDTPELNHVIEQQNSSRIDRAMQIGVCLERIGVEDAYNKACSIAGHKRVGRPHFAALLIQEGKAKDMKAAFSSYLGRGKIAYIPTPWISVQQAVSVILLSGGQAVVAHPFKYKLTRSKLHELISEFKEAGGAGIEVVSGEMTIVQIKEMASLAERFELLASSGSDYHGDFQSRVRLGQQQALPINCRPIWQDWNIEQGTL